MPSVNLADYKGQFGMFHWRLLLDDERNEIRIAFCWKSAKIGGACLFLNSILKPYSLNSYIYALFLLGTMFSRKLVIFQKIFSIKLSYFSIFGNNLKWAEKQFSNFLYLAFCKIDFFFQKKKSEKQFLKINHNFYFD